MAEKGKFLQGKLLLDSGQLGGSFFQRTVVLICKHDAEGAFGLVLNRTVGTPVLVGLDGRREVMATSHEPIDISIAKVRLPLAQSRGYSHFAVVRTKLKWSGGALERDSAQ